MSPFRINVREENGVLKESILNKPAAKCILIVILLLYIPISLFGCQPSFEEQIEEVNKIEDQKILGEIVLDEKRPYEVKYRALEKITDSDVLLKIAHSKSLFTYKSEVIKRIADQEILKNILKDQTFPIYVRPHALWNIKDQELLAETVLAPHDEENDPHHIHFWARSIAILGITNQSLLVKIALSEQKLKGDNIGVIKHGKDLRLFAITRIKDQNLLKYVAQNCHPSIVNDVIETLIRRENLSKTCPIGIYTLITIRHILLELEIIKYYGELRIECKIRSDKEAEYYNPSNPRERAIAYVETVTISIVDKNQRIISKSFFRGASPPSKILVSKERGRHYTAEFPRQITYDAKIDVSRICRNLLKPLDESSLRKITSSNNQLLASIARAMIKK